MFEGSSASGAERAYRKAVEKLTVLLVKAGALHAVRLKRKSVKRIKKKITAAVYEYQADCDGEWGEILFDFENSTAEIVRLGGMGYDGEQGVCRAGNEIYQGLCRS